MNYFASRILFFISWFGMMLYTEVNTHDWYGDNKKSSDVIFTYIISFAASFVVAIILPLVIPFYLFHISIKLTSKLIKTFYKPEDK